MVTKFKPQTCLQMVAIIYTHTGISTNGHKNFKQHTYTHLWSSAENIVA